GRQRSRPGRQTRLRSRMGEALGPGEVDVETGTGVRRAGGRQLAARACRAERGEVVAADYGRDLVAVQRLVLQEARGDRVELLAVGEDQRAGARVLLLADAPDLLVDQRQRVVGDVRRDRELAAEGVGLSRCRVV